MPGTYEEKFAQLRTFLVYMMTHPGKKLLFMGTELAPFSEWKDFDSLDWHLQTYTAHHQFSEFFQFLFTLYTRKPSLYYHDHDPKGFQWIDVHNAEQSIFSYLRWGAGDDYCLVLLNFRECTYPRFRIGVPFEHKMSEICNTDHQKWGGNGMVNSSPIQSESIPFHGFEQSIEIKLPAYSAIILQKWEVQ
jgi:1,4-alpha-glucan branching enzyme